VLRKPFEGKLWPVSLKTHNFCPARQKLLGFRLCSPLLLGEEPCPLSLQTVFSPTGLLKIRIFDSLGQKQRVFEIPTLTLYYIFHHGKKEAYFVDLAIENVKDIMLSKSLLN